MAAKSMSSSTARGGDNPRTRRSVRSVIPTGRVSASSRRFASAISPFPPENPAVLHEASLLWLFVVDCYFRQQLLAVVQTGLALVQCRMHLLHLANELGALRPFQTCRSIAIAMSMRHKSGSWSRHQCSDFTGSFGTDPIFYVFIL